ncbi:MAG: undecaprenyldiphospho-muramoylpentapeptide beta-N-acetylglucosaminyltransferase [Treponema sp.]|nr:undecaprenyldiphospho-muramoylpentapeptide beta-N-acetylglucosaminyltransferase [Treponema sp.]
MKKNKNTFVFAGGGTGGHIYPGLAVADELRSIATQNNEEIKIVWLGNSLGMDKDLVEKSGSVDAFVGLPSGKLRRYFSFKNFTDFFKIFAGCVKAFFTLLKLKPAVLFSKGGFVSVPPCFAAKILGIPVLTHECDFTPGLATRLNSKFASKILVSYEETKAYLPKEKRENVIVTGNPVRPVFYGTNPENGKKFLFENRSDYDENKPILLVLGGSLGAHQINSLIADNLDWLTERFNVVHQCGAKDADIMPKEKKGYFLYPFIYKEMSDVISCADVVLSRAGANSIWECSVLGKPMILIPLCGSGTRGDQVDNAHYFEEKGAASVLLGEYAESDYLKSSLERMLDKETREKAASASLSLSEGKRPAKKIAEIVWKRDF